MGKPYARELEKISDTYSWANDIHIDNLIEFVKKSSKTPLYVIGSGVLFQPQRLHHCYINTLELWQDV